MHLKYTLVDDVGCAWLDISSQLFVSHTFVQVMLFNIVTGDRLGDGVGTDTPLRQWGGVSRTHIRSGAREEWAER